jgi:DNA polymerase-1
MKKVLLIDGNSLLFRAYYATAYSGNIMHTKDGVYTNAIFALSNMLNKVYEISSPDYALVAFDAKGKTFRHEEYKEYKEGRKPAPAELVMQFPLAREMIEKMGFKWFEIVGYEADDIVGTLAKEASDKGYKVDIFSSDRDLLQLVNENISLNITVKGISDINVITPNNIVEFYGVSEKQITDYKGLRGDDSDNIKGIAGVGEKTAIKLLQDYNSIEGIYENIDSIKGKLKEKLIEGKEDAFNSKKLATIFTSVPLEFSIDDCIVKNPGQELVDFYQRYEMFSLMKRVNVKEDEKFEYEIVSKLDDDFLAKELSIYPVFSEPNYHKAVIEGIAFSDGKSTYYLKNEDVFSSNAIRYLTSSSKKIVYDLKALKIAMIKLGVNSVSGLDFKIAANLVNCNLKEDIDSIFNSYGYVLPSVKEDKIKHATYVSFVMSKAFKTILEKIEEYDLKDLYFNLELPLVDVLTKMEDNGVAINKEQLDMLGVEYRFKLNNLENEIYKEAGIEFNIASPKQVAEVLFDKLGLTENKKRSTNEAELEKLIYEHKVVSLILSYRKYAKLLSTYIEGLSSYIYEDGYIHPEFNQTQTQTGRLSSSEPNMQNISVRDEESKYIRKAFPSRFENGYILSIDYSQVELRVLASLSNDENMIRIFEDGDDVHTLTASSVFGLPKEMISDDLRRKAKAINFGIVYGISDWGLAEQIKSTPKEAKNFIERYFLTFPAIKSYLDNVVESCKENGYVTTLYKRRRDVGEINSSVYNEREFGKRVAMNTPIQGTSADIIKIAMLNIHKYMMENNVKSKLVIQIHDELVFDLHPSELHLVDVFKKIMEEASNLRVRLVASSSVGKDWYDAK